jgi:hypothetical protein
LFVYYVGRESAVEFINRLSCSESVSAYEACFELPDIKVLETINDLPSLAYLVALTAFPLAARQLARDLYLLINRATPDLLHIIRAQIKLKLEEIANSSNNCLPLASTHTPAGYNTVMQSTNQILPRQYLDLAKLFLKRTEIVVESALNQPARYLEYKRPTLPITSINKQGKIEFSTRARYAKYPPLKETKGPYEISGFARYVSDMLDKNNRNRITLINGIPLGDETTKIDFNTPLQSAMQSLATEGLTLTGKIALITGAGPGDYK